MSTTLARWNQLVPAEAEQEVLACCGSTAWARAMAARRPVKDEMTLINISDQIWHQLSEEDWMEAFAKHPRIGERKAPDQASAQSAAWSKQEQATASVADQAVRDELAAANEEYERRFARVFLICASGKSAAEILDALRRRLQNDDNTELLEAAEQQRQITNLRLKKWMQT